MTERPTHIPKFGSWDANNHIPYSIVFARARAERDYKLGNQNIVSLLPHLFAAGSKKMSQKYRFDYAPSQKYSKNRARCDRMRLASTTSSRGRGVQGWFCGCFHPDAKK